MYILQTSKYCMNAIKTCVFIENMQKRNFYFRYVKIKIIVLTTQNESIKKIQDASNNKAMVFGQDCIYRTYRYNKTKK